MPRYDPETALLVVDVQNDFADPSGSLYVKGAETIIGYIDAQVDEALAAGAHVFYTQDWHPPSTPHFAKDGGIWPVHCVGDTWGARFHPGLTVRGPTVHKGRFGEDGYSGFTMRDPETGETKPTEMAALLEASGVTRVVIAGLATDYCVRETTLDALACGYPTTVLVDGVRAVDREPGDGERALSDLREAGAVLVSDADGAADHASDVASD